MYISVIQMEAMDGTSARNIKCACRGNRRRMFRPTLVTRSKSCKQHCDVDNEPSFMRKVDFVKDIHLVCWH